MNLVLPLLPEGIDLPTVDKLDPDAAPVLAIALSVFLFRTDLGRLIRASADNPYGALVIGTDVRQVYAAAFGIGADEPASMARPPSAATLLAALPAPPATISAASYFRMRTGASRDTRDTCP